MKKKQSNVLRGSKGQKKKKILIMMMMMKLILICIANSNKRWLKKVKLRKTILSKKKLD